MIELISDILQEGANLSIELNTEFFGVECKIYYPKDFGSYSGNYDDIKFSTEPDLEKRLLIPDIYNLRRTPTAGISDSLFQEDLIMYVKHDLHIPSYSKIVAILDTIGPYQFIVQDTDSVTTTTEIIYRELRLTPFVNFTKNDPELNQSLTTLKTEYEAEKTQLDYDDNNSISEEKDITIDKVSFKFREIT